MHAPTAVRYTALDAVAFAGMFVFGIVMALVGAAMPVLTERLSLGLDDAGTLFLVTNAAMLAASLLVGPVMDRAGMKAPIAAGVTLVAIALLVISTVSRMGDLLLALACLGFGGGAVNASTNTLVADLHEDPQGKASALNLLGVFFGFGALLLPFSIGVLLSRVGLGGVLVGGAVLCAITGLVAVALRFPAPKQPQGLAFAAMPRFLRMPVVLALAFLLFFESGNEFVLGGYFTTFLIREFAVPVERASYLLAGYWGAIMMSRLFLSRAVLRIGAHRVVTGGAVLATAGALGVSVAPGASVAAGGILLTGLALAGIFPTVLSVAGARFSEHSGTVFGLLFTAALTGGMTMPWLAGHLAAGAGLRSVFVLAAVGFVGVAAFWGPVWKRRSMGLERHE
ncbi:MAG TPA: MFS transporter [Vicinamibacterales bacterium]|nr:MFS transporter [Vicinamibacterales bacterium]